MTSKSFDVDKIIAIAKNVAISSPASDEVLNILYANDEGTKPTVADINTLLNFVHEKQKTLLKPKSVSDLVLEIMNKIGVKRKRNSSPITKDELIELHAWVMSRR